jgi:hypothetical protein
MPFRSPDYSTKPEVLILGLALLLLLYRFNVHSKMYLVLVYHALYVTQPLLPFPGKLQTSEEESVGKSVGKLATFWIGRAPWTELYYGTTHPLQSCQLPSTPRWRTLLTSLSEGGLLGGVSLIPLCLTINKQFI